MKPGITFLALWLVMALVACAQTTATKTTGPQQEESRQTGPAGSQTSSETSESGRQKSQATSKPGETTSAAESPGPKTESPPPASAESESRQIEQKSVPGQSTTVDSADARLAQARENLRISRETEKRITDELEQLKASGGASEEAVRDYETYLKSVASMTAENRKIVEQMQAAYARKSPGQTGSKELDKMANPDIPEEQTMDEVAALDSQLNESLAKFDDLLLKEMDEIRAGSSGKMQDLAEEAAEAAKRLREQGLAVNTSGSESSEESQAGREGGPATDQEGESAADRTGTEKASKAGSRKGGEGPSGKDQRRADYEDDDIVARQLREAAENETDPELKEKLWKEYEEYKKSR